MQSSEVQVSADIAAPVERVWGVVSDITVMPRFSTELQSVEWVAGFDAPAVGAQFLGTNENPAIGVWTTRSEITAFDPPRVFEWAVGNPAGPAAVWRLELEPVAGGTRLRYVARLGPGRSGVTMLIEREPHRAREIVENRMHQFTRGMQAVVAGVAALAESG